MSNNTTIFAPACPAGGAISIVRISGAGVSELLRRFFIPKTKVLEGEVFPEHRRMTYADLISHDGELIDTCSFVYYRAPNSYTGEDMAEVFLHGSPAVINAFASELITHGAVRAAEPGEFTKRAFLSGKLDLSGAEAVMDMISASTELSRRAAAYQLAGGLRNRIDALYDELNDTASYLGAVLDYPDEMEDEAISGGELKSRLSNVENSL
ncbi:MAG: tRNA uridine-5-carboxymethylaminomethyl(34) synthesis GTPase MnmE, partial [Clostridia bacterium]|nr:tRNA uridine-5-carboxymethylaminomethyl(34) synthesis GTPase MnmE [Clostridia bacterium]